MLIYQTREEWLHALADKMRPLFESVDAKLPDRFRITMSLLKAKKAVGTCYSPESSGDQTYEILIRIDQDNPLDIAGTLAHELIHAAVGLECKHHGAFKRTALAIGLRGKMTHTENGEEFVRHVEPLLKEMGDFPHAKLNFNRSSEGPRQTTRLLKVECKACGYTVRVTDKWLEVGPPHCPQHGAMIKSLG